LTVKENEKEYTPTATEEKLLAILLDPRNRMKTVAAICREVGCNPITYYRAFKKPEFAELYRQLTFDLIKGHVGPIVNTFVKCAKEGSFHHGKVLLEMAEMYTEKQQHELTGDIHVNFGIPRPPKDKLFDKGDDEDWDDDREERDG
jgi:hypothetical protein